MANPATSDVQGDFLAGTDDLNRTSARLRLKPFRVPSKRERMQTMLGLRRVGPLTSKTDHASIGTAFTPGSGRELTLMPRKMPAGFRAYYDSSNQAFAGRNMTADGRSLVARCYPMAVVYDMRASGARDLQRRPRTAELDIDQNPPNPDLIRAPSRV